MNENSIKIDQINDFLNFKFLSIICILVLYKINCNLHIIPHFVFYLFMFHYVLNNLRLRKCYLYIYIYICM